MSHLIALKAESLGAEFARKWQVVGVSLAVVYHIAALSSLVCAMQAPELLIEPIGLRVSVVDLHEIVDRSVFLHDFRGHWVHSFMGSMVLLLDCPLGLWFPCWKLHKFLIRVICPQHIWNISLLHVNLQKIAWW